ncbi:MAG: helicase-associated domain-containing protein [Acidimicrobiales bacterium]
MNFLDHLGSWSAEDLSYLMEARPDLLPASDRGLEAVARKAGTAMSLGRVLVNADVGMLVVAEALVARHPATVEDLDDLLGTDDVAAVIDAVERLRRTGVVVVDGGVVSPVGSLRDLLHRPLGLGPSFAELAEHLPTETIDRLARDTNAEGAEKRSATVRAIAHRLTQPEIVERLLAGASEPTRELLAALVNRRSPAIPLPTGYPYRGLDLDDPLAWLVEAGLVVAVTESVAELPRELVIAGLPEGLAPTASLRPVELRPVDGLSAEVVSGTAADNANRLLDGAETLLRLIGEGEVSIRKAGGVGPREIKRLAKVCRLETIDVARLFELVGVARLIKVIGSKVTTSDLAARWWSMARHRRYLALVRAWMASDRFLSRGLAEQPDPDKIVALGDSEPIAAVGAARDVTLSAICGLPPGTAYEPEQLAESVVWQGPNLWGAGDPAPEALVGWTIAEAEFLGLVSNEAPGEIGRALMSEDEAVLDRVVAEALADDQDKFVLQSDMTAVAFGPLTPSISRSLAEMTERSTEVDPGRAPVFRFTESSVRRAFDRGWNAESITGFLTEHALAGVPQPLEYLLADVARRYGSVRVMPAQSVIVAGDDITAVEIASNRKAANLGLRLVAPTVLTSPLDPVTVVEALRALGLFPMLDGSTVVIDGPRSDPSEAANNPPIDLPADWTGPPIPTGPFPDEVVEAVAMLTASGDGADADRAGRPAGSPTDDRAGDRSAAERGCVGAGESIERQVTTTQLLQPFWGRAVVIDAVVGGHPEQHRGSLVGLGQAVSLLTTTGVVELATDAVVAVTDPRTL